MEDLLHRNIQQTEVLFQGVNPYVPPNPAQSYVTVYMDGISVLFLMNDLCYRLKRKLKELALEEEELKVARHSKWRSMVRLLRVVQRSYPMCLCVCVTAETSFASASQPEIKLLGYDDSAQRQAQAAATASSSSSTRGSSTVNHQQLVTIKPKDKDATPVVSSHLAASCTSSTLPSPLPAVCCAVMRCCSRRQRAMRWHDTISKCLHPVGMRRGSCLQ